MTLKPHCSELVFRVVGIGNHIDMGCSRGVSPRFGPFLIAVVIFGVCGLFNVQYYKFRSVGASHKLVELTTLSKNQKATARLIRTSDYEERFGPIGNGWYPHENLVEMYQPTTLSIEFEGIDVDDSEVSWQISGTDEAEDQELTGKQVRVSFVELGRHSVVVSTLRGRRYKFDCTARYVRRELRDLTVADRELYFNAVSVVYRTSQAEGERSFGKSFRSAAWLVREHLYGAADRACDHWHDDAGFLNHHVGITMQ